jgi:hypothetical protein
MRLLILIVTASRSRVVAGRRRHRQPGSFGPRCHVMRSPGFPFISRSISGYCQQEGLALTLSEVAGLSKAAEALPGGSVEDISTVSTEFAAAQ